MYCTSDAHQLTEGNGFIHVHDGLLRYPFDRASRSLVWSSVLLLCRLTSSLCSTLVVVTEFSSSFVAMYDIGRQSEGEDIVSL